VRKRLIWILCFSISMLIVACKNDNEEPISLKQEQSTSVASVNNTLTKEEVIKIFSNENGNENCIVTDCVIAEDLVYGLIGVVQYTNKDGNPCNLAFVKDDWSYPVGLDANNIFVIDQKSILTYAGNGLVNLSLENSESGVVYDFTVQYSHEGATTNFKISSSERK